MVYNAKVNLISIYSKLTLMCLNNSCANFRNQLIKFYKMHTHRRNIYIIPM